MACLTGGSVGRHQGVKNARQAAREPALRGGRRGRARRGGGDEGGRAAGFRPIARSGNDRLLRRLDHRAEPVHGLPRDLLALALPEQGPRHLQPGLGRRHGIGRQQTFRAGRRARAALARLRQLRHERRRLQGVRRGDVPQLPRRARRPGRHDPGGRGGAGALQHLSGRRRPAQGRGRVQRHALAHGTGPRPARRRAGPAVRRPAPSDAGRAAPREGAGPRLHHDSRHRPPQPDRSSRDGVSRDAPDRRTPRGRGDRGRGAGREGARGHGRPRRGQGRRNRVRPDAALPAVLRAEGGAPGTRARPAAGGAEPLPPSGESAAREAIRSSFRSTARRRVSSRGRIWLVGSIWPSSTTRRGPSPGARCGKRRSSDGGNTSRPGV